MRLAAVTGATGYVGGRLVPRLLDAGFRVRVIARIPSRLEDVPWRDRVEVVEGDLDDPSAAAALVHGADVLYSLVHTMASGRGFEAKDRGIAEHLARAAKDAGVRRIVYLGGLHPDGEHLSPHLASRKEVGDIFLASGVPTAVLQAGVIIGSGSASFEMIRHLTETLPYMPAPKWVRNRISPIAVRDVLYYLVAAADLPATVNRAFDIGSEDDLRYGQMMNGYAVEKGLPQRPIASLPVFTPWLASQWVNLVTPVPRALAVPIISSLQYECIVRERDIDEYIPRPDGGLTPYRRAVRLALTRERAGDIETSWRNTSVLGQSADPLPSDPEWTGHRVFTDERTARSTAPVHAVWQVVEGIGGDNGWYSLPFAWSIRGVMDRVVGGVGLRRGRRDPQRLRAGDALDWWRVEELQPDRLLRLRAEMKVPGRAWLELEVEPDGEGTRYRQRAVFFPSGLAGRLYWIVLLPFHAVIFPDMAKRIALAAAGSAKPTPT
jgi:uncharacterized protein YbjT (DUF2867 family)